MSDPINHCPATPKIHFGRRGDTEILLTPMTWGWGIDEKQDE